MFQGSRGLGKQMKDKCKRIGQNQGRQVFDLGKGQPSALNKGRNDQLIILLQECGRKHLQKGRERGGESNKRNTRPVVVCGVGLSSVRFCCFVVVAAALNGKKK